MAVTTKINRLTGKFASRETESNYREYSAARDRQRNLLAIMIALPLNFAYVIFDRMMLADPGGALMIRIAAFGLCGILYAMMRTWFGVRRHAEITALAMFVFGGAMILIIARETSLANDYYIGLVQGAVFMSFVVRIGLNRLLIVFAAIFSLFALVTFSIGAPQDAALQCTVLATMFILCAFGVYLFETLHRTEFLQSQVIDRQNRQLSAMLADVQLDNARKVAAMNLLVHFVRTPVHQIVGFTDVISQALNENCGQTSQECLDSVRIIKSASRELSQNVTRLLTYYRLDEKANDEISLIELDHLVRDYSEHFSPKLKVKVDCAKVAIFNRPTIVGAALSALVERYTEDAAGATSIELMLTRAGAEAILTVRDNGEPIEAEEFARRTRPLDKVDHYLSANGSSMPMSLRTVARAAQLAGGDFTYVALKDGRNEFLLSLRDFETKSAADEAA